MPRAEVTFTIITGLSGAGKTQSMKALEDLDFFCIDNLPPVLLPRLVELHSASSTERRNYAVAMDVRGKEHFHQLEKAIEWLDKSEYEYRVIFLECRDSVLVRRYSEARRNHPLAGAHSIHESIAAERRMLAPIREKAHIVLDTSEFKPQDLKAHLQAAVTGRPLYELMTIDVFSFGFKYGAPIDADMVFDVRFLPNPYYVPELRPTTGLSRDCSSYVLSHPMAEEFLRTITELLVKLVPYYSIEGKSRLTVGIGCTGGQHRSVVMAEALAKRLQDAGITSQARHREIRSGNVDAKTSEDEC
ncbi:MAG: glmZ(sRNA)-inactivating NTPase [Firmicutes bacterium ADurb.Bin506]|jgi:UPF0042 nucleotide-binding protein|nr:MAG: glmZ(sRNA)-inactivating NTPase [Firmicutes bacterium ADurb.Bin506]